MALMVGILNQHFMRANGAHLVIDAVATAAGLSFNMVKRLGMDYGARRPGSAGIIGGFGDLLKPHGVGTKTTGRINAWCTIAGFVSGHDPRSSDRILAQIHIWSSRRRGEHWKDSQSTGICLRKFSNRGNAKPQTMTGVTALL